jgi:mono/diheme cytochrome c family protein
MTPFGPVITDDQTIAALATYIRQEWGNNASAVSPEKVAEIREAEKSRPTQWTAEELMKIPVAD